MYGIQTLSAYTFDSNAFENDVKMYGIQTYVVREISRRCLRMM